MSIRRREFLKQSALGVGGVLMGAQLVRAEAAPQKFVEPFELVPLGRTGLKFSRVTMGTGSHAYMRQSNTTREGRPAFQKLLRDAYERGIRTFDLADLYGSHTYLPPAMDGVPREKYNLISKIWWSDGGLPEDDRPPADVVVARFLRELKTDYIDLLLLHCVMAADWPGQLRWQMDILSKLKAQGKIRALGVSCHSIAALEAAAAEPWVESVHARINPYGMSMDGSPLNVVPVLKKIHAAGKGVVGMKLIGEGRLRNDDLSRDTSVKFVLGLGCVDVLNVGFERVEEIDDFTARVRKVPAAA
jgi:aryl-alcohol dehydrogenase-like predicted oxidoreductase